MNSKNFVDIKIVDLEKNNENHRRLLNLSYKKPIIFPIKKIIAFILPIVSVFCVLTWLVSPATAPAAGSSEERAALEAQLADYEKQIAETEATIAEYKKKGSSLSLEVKKLEAQVSKLNLQIKQVTLNLSKLDKQIGETTKQIVSTQGEIEKNKSNLSVLLKTIYENSNRGLVEVILKNPDISDFFSDVSELALIQDNLRVQLQNIIESKQKLVDQKEALAIERSDVQALKEYQDQQKQGIQKTQSEKNKLLTETKGKESVYQKILEEKKKTAAQIRQQIFQLIGGGELNFEKAYELAKYAEKATGVRAALILAVLDRESALGKNVGRCDYKTSMHPTRDIPVFLEIVEDLGLTKNLEDGLLKVSCANADGVYGGAMGPAQFIPSTWKMYSSKISTITGNKPANPWDNRDAFVATGLYLKTAGAATNEKIAAAKYYCGNNWNRYACTGVYAAKVLQKAEQFQDDIDVLNS